MSHFFNKQVLVLFDTTDRYAILSARQQSQKWLGGVIGTVTYVKNEFLCETTLIISSSEYNHLQLYVKQTNSGQFYLLTDDDILLAMPGFLTPINFELLYLSIIPLPSIPSSIAGEGRSIFDIWLKRIFFPHSQKEIFVTHLRVAKKDLGCAIIIGNSESSMISIESSSELVVFSNINEYSNVTIILPDERILQLLNKRFKRVMSLDALSVVAKYLI